MINENRELLVTQFKTVLIITCCFILITMQSAYAVPGIQVKSSGAQYSKALHEEVVVDMEVKVMGGTIEVKRQWQSDVASGGRWFFNPEWINLAFYYNNANVQAGFSEVPQFIRRSNFSYKRQSNNSNIYVYDKRKTIVRSETGYRWSDRNGNWIDYDLQGGIVAYGDRNNVSVRFVRDASGRIETVRDQFDNIILTFIYDAQNRITSVTDYSNRTVVYSYTGIDLTIVTDVRGFNWQYAYETILGRRVMKSKTDPEGRVIRLNHLQSAGGQVCVETEAGDWTYNSQTNNWEHSGGRCIRWAVVQPTLLLKSIVDEIGPLSKDSYFYDANKKQYTHTRILDGGRRVVQTRNLRGEILKEEINGEVQFETEISKDRRTRVRTDRLGLKTTYKYDQNENQTEIIYPDKTREKWAYDQYSNVLTYTNANGVTEKNEYDANGNLIRKTEALGTPVERVTEYQYDLYGNLTQKKQVGDAVTAEAITSWTYDNYGNVLAKTDPEGNITKYTYDVLGNVLVLTDGRANKWIKTYDAVGNLLTDTDPLNQTTRYEYDQVGNLIKKTDALKNATIYAYNARNQRISETNAYNKTKIYTFNSQNQMIRVTDEDNKSVRADYDLYNRLTSLTDGSGNVTQFQFGVGNAGLEQISKITYPTYVERFYYDTQGRLVKLQQIVGENDSLDINFKYDPVGNQVEVTDTKNRKWISQYDALNRLILKINPDNKSVRISIDDRDNLLNFTNENSVVIRRFEYDRVNSMLAEIWPNGERYQFLYDENYNLVQHIDAKGQISRYVYDAANRMTTSSYYRSLSEVQPQKRISYTYNNVGSMTGYDDGQTRGLFDYDNLQRVLSETVYFSGFSLTHSYTYTPSGRKASLTYPDNTIIQYAYDAANQLNRISIPGQGNITINSYRWRNPEKITYPGGSIQRNEFDALSRIQKQIVNDPAGNLVMDYQYHYDGATALLEKKTEHGTYIYGYDFLERVISADSPTLLNEQYGYDETGNRITSNNTVENWKYNISNQLLDSGTTQFSYDLNGSMVGRIEGNQVQNFTYGLQGRLREVRDSNKQLIATYSYDPYGRRISKEVSGIITYYYYSDEGLIAEYNTNGEPIQVYGYSPDSIWGADPVFTRVGKEYLYYLNDHLGTPQKLINTTGAVRWSSKQSSFGETKIDSESTIVNNLRFPGQYFDQETGFHYNYYRYYDPTTGRYISRDPISLIGGNNEYLYADLNPNIVIDNTGLLAGAIAGGICAAVQDGGGCEIFWGALAGSFGPISGFVVGQMGAQACSDGKDRCKDAAKAAVGDAASEVAKGPTGRAGARSYAKGEVKKAENYQRAAKNAVGGPQRDPGVRQKNTNYFNRKAGTAAKRARGLAGRGKKVGSGLGGCLASMAASWGVSKFFE